MQHGMLRIFRVIKFSYAGLKVLWRGEEAFRQEVILGIIAGIVLNYLGASSFNQIVFVALMLLLFSVEALNTALEYIADKIDSSQNDFTRDVKDLGAVAVFFILLIVISWWVYSVFTIIG